VTETAAAGVCRGADGHDLEADRRGCNLQAHTENLAELNWKESA
jgi:hypothetical protein